jgi:hypothetical protein
MWLMAWRLALAGLVFVSGCSAVTDFDRFEDRDGMGDDDDDDDDDCARRDFGDCAVGVEAPGGVCAPRPVAAGTGCQATPNGCFSGTGTCDGAGTCVAEQLPAGSSCRAEAGASCFAGQGECNARGVCIAEPVTEDNDTCGGAVPLAASLPPGNYQIPVGRCVTDTFEPSCTAGGGLDAFYRYNLPVARWIQARVTNDAGRTLPLNHSVSFLEGCGAGAEEVACLTSEFDPIADGWLLAGSYVVALDVQGLGANDVLPTLALDVTIDPQARCETAPLLFDPLPGDDPSVTAANTSGARDDFDLSGLGNSGPDHAYELQVDQAGTFTITTFEIIADELGPAEMPHTDTVLGVGTTCGGIGLGFNDDDVGLFSSVTVFLGPGSYFISVDGFDSEDVGSYGLEIARLE